MDFLNEAWGWLLVAFSGIASLLYLSLYKPKPDVDLSDSFVPTEPLNTTIESPVLSTTETTREKIYRISKSLLGKDLVDRPDVPDELQCASSVNEVVRRATGNDIGGGASTALMWEHLKSDPRFEEIKEWLPGDIIISPTGTSKYRAPNGHVGICGKTHIMSNNSLSGLWDTYFTDKTWHAYYAGKKGFPVYYFRVLG